MRACLVLVPVAYAESPGKHRRPSPIFFSPELQEYTKLRQILQQTIAPSAASSLLHFWARECHRLSIASVDHSGSGRRFRAFDKDRPARRYNEVSARGAADSITQGMRVYGRGFEDTSGATACRRMWRNNRPSEYSDQVGLEDREGAQASPRAKAALRVLFYPQRSIRYFANLASQELMLLDTQANEGTATVLEFAGLGEFVETR